MHASALFLLAALLPRAPQSDTTTFVTADVRELVGRAAVRRRGADSAVTDYRATVRYRLSAGFGRRQWALIPPAVVEEQVARVQWQRPNDLRVEVEGRRLGSRPGAVEVSSVFDRPWFVPRGVGDSVRIFSHDFPATGALHPLSAAGPAWYRYARTGGVALALPDGRTLRLVEIEVVPKRSGPALIAGRMLVDSASGDVVRMTFRYVGTALWARVGDPRVRGARRARRINAVANRVLSINADLEYALQDGRHWMPYRQVVFGTARLPILNDAVIPFRATTVFDDYEINTGRPIAFTLPDSLRSWNQADRGPGGRYELYRPSDDSLARYSAWDAPLELRNPRGDDERLRDLEASLAGLAEGLPGGLTGRVDHGVGYERPADLLRYDRVQGLSLGAGYRVRVPLARFTSLYATARYGFSDERVTGRLAVRGDAPRARITLGAYHDVLGADPFASGRSFGNSLNALFAAHDNDDYLVATGAAAGFETSVSVGLDLSAGVRVERQRGAARTAESAVNDLLGGGGFFPPNAAVEPGTFGALFVRLDGFGGTRWSATADATGAEGRSTARVFGELRRAVGRRRGATLRLKGGVGSEPGFPQTQFRLGGLNTVRGFEYGFRRAPAFWAAQLDVAPVGGWLRPVAFVDAGQAGRAADLFSSDALVGGGIGLSLFRGVVRLDFSVPMTPDIGGKVRFDFVVRGVR